MQLRDALLQIVGIKPHIIYNTRAGTVWNRYSFLLPVKVGVLVSEIPVYFHFIMKKFGNEAGRVSYFICNHVYSVFTVIQIAYSIGSGISERAIRIKQRRRSVRFVRHIAPDASAFTHV